MTLLKEILDRPLDPGYAAAAARRAQAGLPRATSSRSVLVVVAAVVIGFVLVAAAQTLRPSGTTASRDKQLLIDQIQSRQARGDRQAATANALRSQIAASQSAALGDRATALTDELDRLDLLTGDVAATGPGLTLTIDDAADAGAGLGSAGQPRDPGVTDTGRVTSADLQIVVNGLWQAGAEAISVNGQRLTSASAIRFAGETILVDFRPLTPPYVITAIGDEQGLPAAFAQNLGGSYLTALHDNYQIGTTLSPSGRVEVPRSTALEVKAAHAVPGAGSSSSAGASTGSGGSSGSGGSDAPAASPGATP